MLKKVPHTYVIIFYIIVFVAIVTWIVPGGKYVDVITNVDGIEKVEKEFQYIESQPQTWQIFSSFYKGFVDKSDIIVFILMIGGAFWIMNSSKAIDVGILSFLKKIRKFERFKLIRLFGIDNIIITMIMLVFSTFGAVFGMSEETIAFIIIVVPLSISMGYDSIVGVSLAFVAAGLGFAGAILNPFTIGIAQGLSDIPLFSGIEYRMFSWVIINIVGIAYVLRYAKKIKKNPKKSIVYNEDKYWRERSGKEISEDKYYTPISAYIVYFIILVVLIIYSFFPSVSEFVKDGQLIIPRTIDFGFIKLVETQLRIGETSYNILIIPIITAVYAVVGFLSLRKSVHYFILLLLFLTMVLLVVGVMGYDWYIMKIATIFFAMGIASGIASNYSPDRITKLFVEGVKDILGAAIVVGLAGGIIAILQDGKVIDTVLHSMAESMEGLGKIATVGIMYVIQTIINVVIPSGSAKAALTMPIMAPFSDLIGISRQANVMAFQFGDGFTNMITPTSGVLIAVLGVAKIPYEKWVKWITPLMIILMILGFLLLIPTVTMQLNGF
jgi:uncharacterized ion transporter superfamily protein YfcC